MVTLSWVWASALRKWSGLGYLTNEPGQLLDQSAGAVTTGEAWQFLRLEGTAVTLHPQRLFIDNLGGILAALRLMLLATSHNAGVH